MRPIKLTIPLALALLFGIFGFGIQYVVHPWAADTKEVIALWSRVIGGIATLLGIYSLVHLHMTKIQRKQEGWGYSLFFFLGFLVITAAVVYNGGRWLLSAKVEQSVYDLLYEALYVSAGATMFSLLGFYIASAAVRTFRARSFEAALLLAAAIVVMVGQVPIGAMISPYFPGISEWALSVPNMAAKRAIMMGVSLGAIATSLRIIFGLERSYLGGGD
jgi:hypothetical protein